MRATAIISQRAEGTARGDRPFSLLEKVGMRAPLGLTPAHESGRECRVGAKHSATNLGFREETNAECFTPTNGWQAPPARISTLFPYARGPPLPEDA